MICYNFFRLQGENYNILVVQSFPFGSHLAIYMYVCKAIPAQKLQYSD
jgi:hypothetical protein